jgi:hypothetical protein
LLKEYQVVYLKEVSRNVVNTKASTAFVQRLIVASSLLSSMRVAYIALAAAKRGAGCALHVTLDFISRTPVTLSVSSYYLDLLITPLLVSRPITGLRLEGEPDLIKR